MKNRLQSLSFSLMVILISVLVISVYDTRASEYNFELLTYKEQSQIVLDIITSVSQGDIDGIESSAPYMTEQVYIDLTKDSSTKIMQGNIGQLAVDVIDVESSSTGDTVIMANAKVWTLAQTYNNLYLYEFHVNRDGKIYGYNLWVY